MRFLPLCLLALASPAAAWEFTPGLPCLLTHAEPQAEVTLTFDPGEPRYSIAITRPEAWAGGDVFSLSFEGPRGLTISTTRHALSGAGRTLTVSDRGFGNVLNGLQFNTRAIAILGDEEVPLSLIGAAQPVADFRKCAPLAAV